MKMFRKVQNRFVGCREKGKSGLTGMMRDPSIGFLAKGFDGLGVFGGTEGLYDTVLSVTFIDDLDTDATAFVGLFSHKHPQSILTGHPNFTFFAFEIPILWDSLIFLLEKRQSQEEAGCRVESDGERMTLYPAARLRAFEISTTEYPGFPTDMQAQFMALATQAEGVSIIEERLFENRFMHVSELQRLGASIHLKGNTATLNGPIQLLGADVMATDLRASSALVLGGMAASGVTDGEYLKGVQFHKGGAISHSVVMRSESSTIRQLQTSHRFDYRPDY
jgi:hypothetical protein